MPKRAKAAPAAPSPTEPPLAPARPPETTGKLAALITLLRRPGGATLAQLAAAVEWKEQSVRGALAGALKARGHVVTSEKTDGVRVYRLPAPAAAEAAS